MFTNGGSYLDVNLGCSEQSRANLEALISTLPQPLWSQSQDIHSPPVLNHGWRIPKQFDHVCPKHPFFVQGFAVDSWFNMALSWDLFLLVSVHVSILPKLLGKWKFPKDYHPNDPVQ